MINRNVFTLLVTLTFMGGFFSPPSSSALEKTPFGEGLHNELLQRITAELWDEFRIKLQQLSQTYSLQKENNTIIYTSVNGFSCHKDTAENQIRQVAKIQLNQEYLREDKKHLHVVVTYFGCSGRESFREVFTVQSLSAITPWNLDMIQFGRRRWALSEKEVLREHSIVRPNQQQVLSIRTRRDGDELETLIKSDQKQLARLFWDGKKHTIEPFSFEVMFEFSGGPPHRHQGMDFNKNLYVQRRTLFNTYLDRAQSISPQVGEVSKVEFDQLFRQRVIEAVAGTGKWYMGAVIKYDLPPSEFSSSGDKNRKLIQELNRTILQITTNPDQARVFLQNLLKAVEDNQIVDNWPKESN